jgi:hypothetical protein
MSLKEVRKQDRSKMADVIHALMRRKNKEGITREERIKEDEEGKTGRKEVRKKEKRKRKKENILSAECERDTKNSVSSPTGIETRFLAYTQFGRYGAVSQIPLWAIQKLYNRKFNKILSRA